MYDQRKIQPWKPHLLLQAALKTSLLIATFFFIFKSWGDLTGIPYRLCDYKHYLLLCNEMSLILFYIGHDNKNDHNTYNKICGAVLLSYRSCFISNSGTGLPIDFYNKYSAAFIP